MTTTTRLAAVAAALLMTLATVHSIAGYALPHIPTVQLASASR
jgi:hypothetical protein